MVVALKHQVYVLANQKIHEIRPDLTGFDSGGDTHLVHSHRDPRRARVSRATDRGDKPLVFGAAHAVGGVIVLNKEVSLDHNYSHKRRRGRILEVVLRAAEPRPANTVLSAGAVG